MKGYPAAQDDLVQRQQGLAELIVAEQEQAQHGAGALMGLTTIHSYTMFAMDVAMDQQQIYQARHGSRWR